MTSGRAERSVRTDIADVRIVRLALGDGVAARRMFEMLNAVFDTVGDQLSDEYVEHVLRRDDFWALGAFVDERVVGGITAHELPMTRGEHRELFIYDLAVMPSMQRSGIGRSLIQSLVGQAAERGIEVVFVPADNEDEHALAFYRAIGGRPSAVTMFDLGPG